MSFFICISNYFVFYFVEELAELRISDPGTTNASSSMSNGFDLLNFFSATDACPTLSSRRTSPVKRMKRLNNK